MPKLTFLILPLLPSLLMASGPGKDPQVSYHDPFGLVYSVVQPPVVAKLPTPQKCAECAPCAPWQYLDPPDGTWVATELKIAQGSQNGLCWPFLLWCVPAPDTCVVNVSFFWNVRTARPGDSVKVWVNGLLKSTKFYGFYQWTVTTSCGLFESQDVEIEWTTPGGDTDYEWLFGAVGCEQCLGIASLR